MLVAIYPQDSRNGASSWAPVLRFFLGLTYVSLSEIQSASSVPFAEMSLSRLRIETDTKILAAGMAQGLVFSPSRTNIEHLICMHQWKRIALAPTISLSDYLPQLLHSGYIMLHFQFI